MLYILLPLKKYIYLYIFLPLKKCQTKAIQTHGRHCTTQVLRNHRASITLHKNTILFAFCIGRSTTHTHTAFNQADTLAIRHTLIEFAISPKCTSRRYSLISVHT